jgi:hypothetical protein
MRKPVSPLSLAAIFAIALFPIGLAAATALQKASPARRPAQALPQLTQFTGPTQGRYSIQVLTAYVNGNQVGQGDQPPRVYLGTDFTGSTTPVAWWIVPGKYNGAFGSWIFRGDRNCTWPGPFGAPPTQPPAGAACRALQATSGGPFAYWNVDGRATGTPEDFELFEFKPVGITTPPSSGYKLTNIRISGGSFFNVVFDRQQNKFQMGRTALDFVVVAVAPM